MKRLNVKKMGINFSRTMMLSMALLAVVSLSSCKDDAKESVTNIPENSKTEIVAKDLAMVDATFGVRGNCGMCKLTIEKSAKSIEGVSSADWSVEEKNIKVTYDNTKTSVKDIEEAIALSGYDTSNVTAKEKAYLSNAKCCQYKRTMEIK